MSIERIEELQELLDKLPSRQFLEEIVELIPDEEEFANLANLPTKGQLEEILGLLQEATELWAQVPKLRRRSRSAWRRCAS